MGARATRTRSGPACALAVALALLVMSPILAACVAGGPPQPPGGPPLDAGSPDPRLARFYDQKLRWGPCGDFAQSPVDRQVYTDPAYQCTRLQVPLDYAEPDGTVAELGVLRTVANGRDRIGSLVLNPGGPGASGMSLVPALAGSLNQGGLDGRFDLVGFDPRGVGASLPRINCLDRADWEAERADVDVDPGPAGVAKTEQENRTYAQRCAERSGGADVLAHVGTRDAARDMDVLRAALGEEKLTYLGYSYGTRLGTAYAEAFPARVRAMVLDGAIDPDEGIAEQTIEQAVGFQRAFDAFAKECAGRRGCPLGSDPAGAVAAYQRLVRPLIDRPAKAAEGRTLSYSDALVGTHHALYQSNLWPVLRRGLAALAAGDGTILLALADEYYERSADGSYGNALESFVAISCVDEQRITDPAAQQELANKVNAAAPFRDTGRGAVGAREACAFWPVPPTSQPHLPKVDGLPRSLVVSTTGDPATPYEAGVKLAEALRAQLLTVDGNQHTAAFQGSGCVDQVVAGYLIDPATPIRVDRCAL